jgi:hypothetical protein
LPNWIGCRICSGVDFVAADMPNANRLTVGIRPWSPKKTAA